MSVAADIVRVAALVLALPLSTSSLLAETLEVPDDYDTIQEAIDAAFDGDVVLVSAGTYEENIDFLGKAITVESTDGPEETIIDGQYLSLDDVRGSVVSFINGEGPDSQLVGFALEGGIGYLFEESDDRLGGGVVCLDSSPELRDCRIRFNEQGAYAADSAVSFHDCVLEGNTADFGAAMSTTGEIDIEFQDCEIVENQAWLSGILEFWLEGSVTFERCLISGNDGAIGPGGILGNTRVDLQDCAVTLNSAGYGGGMALFGGGTITGCRLEANVARVSGAGMILDGGEYDVVDCIFSGNHATSRGGAAIITRGTIVRLDRCTIAGNEAEIEGGALRIYNVAPGFHEDPEVLVASCIVWDNGDEPFSLYHGSLEFTYSCRGWIRRDRQHR